MSTTVHQDTSECWAIVTQLDTHSPELRWTWGQEPASSERLNHDLSSHTARTASAVRAFLISGPNPASACLVRLFANWRDLRPQIYEGRPEDHPRPRAGDFTEVTVTLIHGISRVRLSPVSPAPRRLCPTHQERNQPITPRQKMEVSTRHPTVGKPSIPPRRFDRAG